ncbi:hypothetical protein [Chryseobacterium artocarpi]|uniref:hypothetical protein n=1 Tax=Chryseobacterium artocarpi TaxID=1414727 RepID=UPI003F401EC4
MKAKLSLLLLSLLMPILYFSQSGYPKQIVSEGDSLVAITKHQVKLLNLTKVTLDRQLEINKEKDVKIKALEAELKTTEDIVSKQDERRAISEAEIANRQELITEQDKTIQQLNKSLKREKVKKGFLIGAAVVVIASVLIFK